MFVETKKSVGSGGSSCTRDEGGRPYSGNEMFVLMDLKESVGSGCGSWIKCAQGGLSG